MRRRSFVLLVSALAFPFAAAYSAGDATVTVAMRSGFYAPEPIRLAAGQPVTIRLVNQDSSTHAFGARRFFGAAKILSGTVEGGRIELAPGKSATITLVPSKGTYKVECSHHQMEKLGMQGRILVK